MERIKHKPATYNKTKQENSKDHKICIGKSLTILRTPLQYQTHNIVWYDFYLGL